MTATAPMIAPMDANVTPSTNATNAGAIPYFLKYGAGITVSKKQGKNVATAATTAPQKPETRNPMNPVVDDDRAWSNHHHGNCVNELMVGHLQPQRS